MNREIICDEGECPYMDDNTGCFVDDIPGAICPNKQSCMNCKHRLWRVVDIQGNKDYVCGIDNQLATEVCGRYVYDANSKEGKS